MWKGQIFHRERVSAKSDLGCKKFYKDLMVSITPQFFYGFSPTTSSPHITAITTLHESAITLLRFKSSTITLRLSTNTIFCTRWNMHEKKYLHESSRFTGSDIFTEATTFYCLRPIIQASAECCLRNIYKFLWDLSPIYIQVPAGCCLIIWTSYSSLSSWTKPPSHLLQNMPYEL